MMIVICLSAFQLLEKVKWRKKVQEGVARCMLTPDRINIQEQRAQQPLLKKSD